MGAAGHYYRCARPARVLRMGRRHVRHLPSPHLTPPAPPPSRVGPPPSMHTACGARRRVISIGTKVSHRSEQIRRSARIQPSCGPDPAGILDSAQVMAQPHPVHIRPIHCTCTRTCPLPTTRPTRPAQPRLTSRPHPPQLAGPAALASPAKLHLPPGPVALLQQPPHPLLAAPVHGGRHRPAGGHGRAVGEDDTGQGEPGVINICDR
jgi:hypothetical protein